MDYGNFGIEYPLSPAITAFLKKHEPLSAPNGGWKAGAAGTSRLMDGEIQQRAIQ